jgi:putative protease
MTCRHCLRYALGYCTRGGQRLPYREPLSLRLADGRTFPLHFDCKACEMQVLKD